MIQAPRRAARSVRSVTSETSTAMSMAEFPMPSTTTFLPSKPCVSTYSCECIWRPANVSAPGNAGSGQRGSQWWPLATTTAS